MIVQNHKEQLPDVHEGEVDWRSSLVILQVEQPHVHLEKEKADVQMAVSEGLVKQSIIVVLCLPNTGRDGVFPHDSPHFLDPPLLGSLKQLLLIGRQLLSKLGVKPVTEARLRVGEGRVRVFGGQRIGYFLPIPVKVLERRGGVELDALFQGYRDLEIGYGYVPGVLAGGGALLAYWPE